MRKWLPRGSLNFDTMQTDTTQSDRTLAMLADGMALSTDLLALGPPHRKRHTFISLRHVLGMKSALDTAAFVLLHGAMFQMLQVHLGHRGERSLFRDVISGKVLVIQGFAPPFKQTGTVIFARVVLIDDQIGWFVGEITPLYGTSLAIAQCHPAAGATENSRNWAWAEAVYSEAVRTGCRRLRF